jgi:hypothetical protein
MPACGGTHGDHSGRNGVPRAGQRLLIWTLIVTVIVTALYWSFR